MNIRDLEYLVAVANMRHFGKAAEACHVSQPTLSMQLKKLEETLGVTLFERSRKRVMVTPVGEKIVEDARYILQRIRHMRDIARHAQDPLGGELRLGLFPTLAPYFLPHCISTLHQQLPSLKLLLVEEKTDHLLTRLHQGTLDAALLALPVAGDAFEQEILFEDPFMLAVSHTHPLASRKRVTMQDLAKEHVLLLEEGHCLRTQALELCQIVNASEYQEYRATSLETLRHMVATGAGMTLIPKIAMGEGDGLAYIPFQEKKMARTIGMVWRKGASREVAIQAVMGVLREVVRGMEV